MLPRWGRVPPPELLTRQAQDVWGPLAIVDYGDIPAAYVAERKPLSVRFVCLGAPA